MSFLRSIPVSLILLGLAGAGCKTQSPSTAENSAPVATVASPLAAAPLAPGQAIPEANASGVPLDDATLLARKTAEYARGMSKVLEDKSSVPYAGSGTRPSVVTWVDPGSQPKAAPAEPVAQKGVVANQPADLGGLHIAEDTSVPLVLPEDADHIPKPAAAHEAANLPSSTPGRVLVSTDEYEQKLQKIVRDDPRDLANQLNYQLLRFARSEPTPDMASMTDLPSEDRDVIVAVMDGLSNFRDITRADGNLMLSRKIAPLLEMSDRIRTAAELNIPTIALCTEVASYGVYRPMKSNHFPVGQNSEAIVYNEVANFRSAQGADGLWRTRLRQEMVLYTDAGLMVWPDTSNAERFVDQSRNRRHDFFISRKITLPSSLAVGRYVLKVTLTDEQSSRVAEASTPLEVVAPLGQADAGSAPGGPTENGAVPSNFVLPRGE